MELNYESFLVFLKKIGLFMARFCLSNNIYEQDVFSGALMPPDGNIKVGRSKFMVKVKKIGTDRKVFPQGIYT